MNHAVGQRSRVRNGFFLTILCGLALFCLFAGILEFRLRPVVKEIALHQVHNLVTEQINQSLLQMQDDFRQLAVIRQGEQGEILAVTCDMTRANLLRVQVSDKVLEKVSELDVHQIGVPLGSLFDLDILWAKGPLIHVRSLVVGMVTTQINSQFYSSGINQTIHRITVEIQVPLTVLLPGITLNTTVENTLCVAETVIVGQVPDTILSIPDNKTHPIS